MKFIKHNRGFTLIEMIVSLGVFAVVVTITTGALLTLIAANQRYQGQQSVMTNLSFALDSMTREIRTGYNYFCVTSSAAASSTSIFRGPTQHEALAASRRNCNGRGGTPIIGISFYEGGNSITGASANRVLYFYDAAARTIYRRVGDGTPQRMTAGDVAIDQANFFVSDSGTLFTNNDTYQPTVTLYLEARAANDPSATAQRYFMQTTITQRSLDI